MKELGFVDLLTAYKAESSGLGVIGAPVIWQLMDNGFGHYRKYLAKMRKSGQFSYIEQVIRSQGYCLDAGLPDPRVREVFYLAHLAVCCGLFDGWELSQSQLTRSFVDRKIESDLQAFANVPREQLDVPFKSLHISDAARTMHILQLLGLCSWHSGRVRQLSLACGPGDRDIYGLHQVPSPRIVSIKNASGGMRKLLRLEHKLERPKNIVLVDNDPQAARRFSDLNRQHADWLQAFNQDADVVFSELPEVMKSRGWGPRNAVIGLRIDHRMIPDVARFFAQLHDSLDKTVDLVITVGAGHSLEEFEGRAEVIKALFDYLKQRGMAPVIIKLHGQGSLQEQRENPYFGYSPFTTYQILYCRLHREKLGKRLGTPE